MSLLVYLWYFVYKHHLLVVVDIVVILILEIISHGLRVWLNWRLIIYNLTTKINFHE